jgi:hypothetical protein
VKRLKKQKHSVPRSDRLNEPSQINAEVGQNADRVATKAVPRVEVREDSRKAAKASSVLAAKVNALDSRPAKGINKATNQAILPGHNLVAGVAVLVAAKVETKAVADEDNSAVVLVAVETAMADATDPVNRLS